MQVWISCNWTQHTKTTNMFQAGGKSEFWRIWWFNNFVQTLSSHHNRDYDQVQPNDQSKAWCDLKKRKQNYHHHLMMRQDVKQLSYLSGPPWGHQDGRGVLEEQEGEEENFLEEIPQNYNHDFRIRLQLFLPGEEEFQVCYNLICQVWKELMPLKQVVKLWRELSAKDIFRRSKLFKIWPNH